MVDDDDSACLLTSRTLRRFGFAGEIIVKRDGAQAIRFFEALPQGDLRSYPNIIILDLKMPLVDGFEFLEWVKAQAFRPRIVIAVHTSSDEPEDRERALELGANFVLLKFARNSDLSLVFDLAATLERSEGGGSTTVPEQITP